MTEKTTQEKIIAIELDAKGQTLGRLATQIATYLQGKHRADYAQHKDIEQEVKVVNAKRIKVTGNKAQQKMYWHHSGYPGGISGQRYEEVFAKDPTDVLRRAVLGMLPKNKLQARRIRRLTIEA